MTLAELESRGIVWKSPQDLSDERLARDFRDIAAGRSVVRMGCALADLPPPLEGISRRKFNLMNKR